MKFCSILLSLAVLNGCTVSADYTKSVFITNKHIEVTFATNPYILENVINSTVDGDSTMGDIALMFAVPESISHVEYSMFNPLEFDGIQEAVKNKIKELTGIITDPEPGQDIPIDSLPELGVKRRIITERVTENLLSAALSGEKPEILDNIPKMCRLIGLYRSIIFPDSFIKDAKVVYEFCKLTSCNGYVYYYKHQGGTVAEEVQRYPSKKKCYILLADQICQWTRSIRS